MLATGCHDGRVQIWTTTQMVSQRRSPWSKDIDPIPPYLAASLNPTCKPQQPPLPKEEVVTDLTASQPLPMPSASGAGTPVPASLIGSNTVLASPTSSAHLCTAPTSDSLRRRESMHPVASASLDYDIDANAHRPDELGLTLICTASPDAQNTSLGISTPSLNKSECSILRHSLNLPDGQPPPITSLSSVLDLSDRSSSSQPILEHAKEQAKKTSPLLGRNCFARTVMIVICFLRVRQLRARVAYARCMDACLPTAVPGHRRPITQLSLTSDGHRLATASGDLNMTIFRIKVNFIQDFPAVLVYHG